MERVQLSEERTESGGQLLIVGAAAREEQELKLRLVQGTSMRSAEAR